MCICCGGVYYMVGPTRFPFCDRCFGGRCSKCAKAVRDAISGSVSKVNAGGRPPGPRMPCGWGCGAELTGQEMRPHFTRCPNRPTVSDLVRRLATHARRPRANAGSVRFRVPPNLAPRPAKSVAERSESEAGTPVGAPHACGWRCGTQLTASDMRKHFTECPNGRGLSPQVCAAFF